jgi:phosphoribosylglycinamide formyltransferase-1
MAALRVGVLISGGGSNLQALIDFCAAGTVPAEIVSVVSNKSDAGGLERAKRAGIPAHAVPHQGFHDRDAFEHALDARLLADGADFLCLAGFLRILTPEFSARWHDRVLNIHPSLLPAFPGLHTHRQALEAGVRIHGCTVHFVRPALDNGPILVQAAVPVLPGDDEATLAARVLAAEHRAYPLALKLVAEGRVRLDGNRVVIDGSYGPAAPALLNPPDLPSALT